jgi:hypothetical protein
MHKEEHTPLVEQALAHGPWSYFDAVVLTRDRYGRFAASSQGPDLADRTPS